jgi:hypothetical protein
LGRQEVSEVKTMFIALGFMSSGALLACASVEPVNVDAENGALRSPSGSKSIQEWTTTHSRRFAATDTSHVIAGARKEASIIDV